MMTLKIKDDTIIAVEHIQFIERVGRKVIIHTSIGRSESTYGSEEEAIGYLRELNDFISRKALDVREYRREVAKEVLANIAPTFNQLDDEYLHKAVAIAVNISNLLAVEMYKQDKEK